MRRHLFSLSLSAIAIFVFVGLASAALVGPLAQVIEGAKKEGTVSVKLEDSYPEKSMYRFERGIKDRSSVPLTRGN